MLEKRDLKYLEKKSSNISKLTNIMNKLKISPSKAAKYNINIAKDGIMRNAKSNFKSKRGKNIKY